MSDSALNHGGSTYPRVVDGKPVFAFDPNDCCFSLECQLCGGRVWIGTNDQFEGVEVSVGDEVGIAWYAPAFEDPKSDQIMWGMFVHMDDREDYACLYVEPEGGWDE